MPTNNDIEELFSRYIRIENEIKLLQEDKKNLLAEFKDKISPRVFQSALRMAKTTAKLNQGARDEFDQIVNHLEKELCPEHIE